MEEKKEERYIRADVQGGYLYNKSEIDYFKQSQAIDVMNNLMLGDFNEKGNYVLNKAMVVQLVKMTKIYQYSFGSTTFCQSMSDVGGYGKIDFAVKMRNNSQNGTITATLQLLETIDRANGYYQNTNTAPIAIYTAPESNTYIVDMLKFFNIVSKKEEGLLKKERDDEEDIALIIARKKFEEQQKTLHLPNIDELNKQLYEKRLKLLAKSVIGKKILEEFGKESYKINGWFVKEGMPGYYRHLNQVLDGLIELHSAEVLQDVALKAALNKANESFSQSLAAEMKKGAILAQMQQTQLQEEKQQEPAKGNVKIEEKQEKKVVENKSELENPKIEEKNVDLSKQIEVNKEQPKNIEKNKDAQSQQEQKVNDKLRNFAKGTEKFSKATEEGYNNATNQGIGRDNKLSKEPSQFKDLGDELLK